MISCIITAMVTKYYHLLHVLKKSQTKKPPLLMHIPIFEASISQKAVNIYFVFSSLCYRCLCAGVCHRCRMRCCPSSVLQPLRCVRLRPCIRKARSRLPLRIRELLTYISVLVHSLYFNSLTDSDVVFDSVFEPVFLSVDYITRWFGTVCVCFRR